jgi:hypothetical protein
MKKTIIYITAMVFTIALGAVSAKAADKLYNGVTDFSGRTYDSGMIAGIAPVAPIEHVSVGGLWIEEPTATAWNGVTNFAGGVYDSGAIAELEPAGVMIASSVERSSAGGLRMDKKADEFRNGVTDFSGGIYDDTLLK